MKSQVSSLKILSLGAVSNILNQLITPQEIKKTAIFSQELIRPLPKAPPRSIGHKKGRKRRKEKGNGEHTQKPTKNPAKRSVLQDDDSSDDEQKWYCIIRCDVYSNSPLEKGELNAEYVRNGPICNVLKMKKA
ncbi:hypothetical protein WA026_023075 [Henosepilachna vigintioctopunctata]|uniref:Uncharacterized protein n=1 Tax=Henosepilachna vigintioctopunctata TaxID=420089 RepID=A0AAW1V5F0_9CUCU